MSVDGTYGFVYAGVTGIGIGAFVINSSGLVGADFAGGRYQGTATQQDGSGEIIATLTVTIPPGSGPVDGTASVNQPGAIQISQRFPPEFGDGAPQKIALASGSVTLMIKRIPESFSPAATRGFTLQIADPSGDVSNPNPEHIIAPNAAQEIGRFVIAWGSLEHEFEGAITTLLHMAPALRSCLTTNLAFYAKTQIVEQAIAIITGALPSKEIAAEIHDVIKQARSYNEKYRNFIFHWIVINREDGKSVLGARLKGGKSPHYVALEVNPGYFAEIVEKVADLRNRLRIANASLREMVEPIRSWNVAEIPTDQLERELCRRTKNEDGNGR